MFIFDQSVFYIILIFWVIALFLGFLLVVLSYIFIKQSYDLVKLSAYECGFQPFGDIRVSYDVHFYRIAILFLIFDLEIALFLPVVLVITLVFMNVLL